MVNSAEELFEFLGDGWRKFFEEHGIAYVDYNLGFSEKEQKWYGWSHRAIFGFGVGDAVKPGDFAYTADTPEGLVEAHVAFFADLGAERSERARAECQVLPDRSGIRILHEPQLIPMADSLEDLVEHIANGTEPDAQLVGEDAVSVIKCGRGTWTARTLDDAKQMALDFAAGVA